MPSSARILAGDFRVLQLVPESWLAWNFEVFENDRKATEIKTSTLPESGTFLIDGSSFRAYREGISAANSFLRRTEK